jgi:ketosteroid isomerase-like protein
MAADESNRAAESGEGNEQLVERYFQYIRELRTGVAGAPERLTELWDEDGVFEFAGSPPVVGTFVGRNAINVLYKNRFNTSGMPLRLTGDKGGQEMEVALGTVDTTVTRMRQHDRKTVAGWTTLITTEDGRGFQVAGSHTFSFKGGRISRLKVVISPRPEAAESFDLESLDVQDIGRLALAAWAVV